MLFYLAKSTVSKQGTALDLFSARWSIPGFRFTFYLMTVVWGIGLLIEATLKVVLAFSLPIEQFLVIGPLLSYGFYFSLLGWSFWYGRKRKAEGERLAALARQEATNEE